MTTISKKTRNQKNLIIEEIHSYNLFLDSREIFLHNDYSDDENGEFNFKVSSRLIKNLRLLEASGNEPIIIHQQSCGGLTADGLAIYDAIAACSCHVIIIMHGYAWSMGSVIPQAADVRVIMPNCSFMIHDGCVEIPSSTYKQIQSSAEYLKKDRETILDIYAKVCVKGLFFKRQQFDEKQIKEYLIERMNQKEDWWLNAINAVDFGFADGILGVTEGYENINAIEESLCEQ